MLDYYTIAFAFTEFLIDTNIFIHMKLGEDDLYA